MLKSCGRRNLGHKRYIAKNSLTAALAVTSVVCDGACQSVLHSMVRDRHLFRLQKSRVIYTPSYNVLFQLFYVLVRAETTLIPALNMVCI